MEKQETAFSSPFRYIQASFFRYIQLGEPHGIGATMHLLEFICGTETLRIVVDCGVGFTTRNKKKVTYFAKNGFDYLHGKHVHAFIITHAHMDHLGAAARFVAEHPEATVFISLKAFEAGLLMLKDGLNIYRREMDQAWRENGSFTEIPPPVYTEQDLGRFDSHPKLELVEESGWFRLDSPYNDWQIGLHRAGHDQGAMSVFIDPPDSRWPRIVLTGDINSDNQEIEPGVMIPGDDFLGNFLEERPILITETTNGDRLQTKPRAQLREEFVNVHHEVHARGGLSLIHSFMRGRGTEAAHMLLKGNGHGPIYPHLDGGVRAMFRLECPQPSLARLLLTGQVVMFEKGREGEEHRRLFWAGQDPCTKQYNKEYWSVVASSATLEQGASMLHAQNILDKPANACISVGHRFENTAAMTISNIQRGHTIPLGEGKERRHVNVRCDVHHFPFSGHDYQPALVERVRLFNPHSVILHHGTESGMAEIRKAIEKSIPAKLRPTIRWGKSGVEIPFV